MNPGSSKKGYGLFIPKSKVTTKPTLATKASAVFAADDDDDDDNDDGVEKTISKRNASSTMFGSRKSEFEAKLKKQQEIEIEKALAEDPSVFEYDSVYDDLDPLKKERDPKTRREREGNDRKPKYIAGLMAAAEKRMKDYERRTEKKVHEERSQEGNEFAGKEEFVTSAYKKKMEELKQLEADERLQEAKDAAAEVERQKGDSFAGFYRHILDARTGGVEKTEVKQEEEEEGKETIDGDAGRGRGKEEKEEDSHDHDVEDNSDEESAAKRGDKKSEDSPEQPPRSLVAPKRRRRDSDSDDDDDDDDDDDSSRKATTAPRKTLELKGRRARHDSSSSASSSSLESEGEEKTTTKEQKRRGLLGEGDGGSPGGGDPSAVKGDSDSPLSETESESDDDEKADVKPETAESADVKMEVAPAPVRALTLAEKYAKRTTGKAWESARRRYLERKLQRLRSGFSVVEKSED